MTRKILKTIANFILRIIYRIEIIGEENIPKDRACIICANHIHALDGPVITLCGKEKLHFMAKAELFKNPVYNWLGKVFEYVPVKRGAKDMEAIKKSLEILNKKEILAIYPEGTRNGIKKKVKVQNGATFLALKTNSLVVPLGITGTFKPFSKITYNYGKPLDFSKYASKKPEKEVMDKVTAEIMDNIIRLTNN